MRYWFFVFLLFSFPGLKAQLANTTWVGDFAVPTPTECSFIFSADTASLKLNQTNEVVEIMSYRVSGDTLFLRKISGMSPCYDQGDAVYRYKIEDKKLMLTALQDMCDIRRDAFPSTGLQLVEP